MLHQKKLTEPFNLYPDGDESTKVIGFGFSTYQAGNGLAVLLIFENTESHPISVNLSEEARMLEENEFFLKDWSENEHIIEKLVDRNILQVTEKPKVSAGHVMVSTVVLNPAMLTEFSEAEKQHYHP